MAGQQRVGCGNLIAENVWAKIVASTLNEPELSV